MPRRHKSKRHAGGKCNQAQSLTGGCEPAGAAALPAEEPSPSSQGPPPAASASCPRATHTSPCCSSPTWEASESRHEEDASGQEEEEEERPFNAIPSPNNSPPSLKVAMKTMGKILAYNFYAKKLTTEEELLQVLTDNFRYAFPEIFKTACVLVEGAFGVEIREVGTVQRSYELFSQLKLPNNGRIRPGKGYPKTGMLMDVLGLIFKFQGRVSEKHMWDFLKIFKAYPGRKHRAYGEPRKLLTQDFVRLQYLEYRQVPGSEPPCYEFLWGPEAHTDTCKAKIMEREFRVSKADRPFFQSVCDKSLRDEEERGTTGGAAMPGSTAKAMGDPRATEPEASPSPDYV